MNPLLIRILLIAAVFVGGIVTGVKAHMGIVAERDLAQSKERAAVVQEFRNTETQVAERVASEVQKINSNQTVIEHEKIKIVDRPIYRSQCLDSDGLQLLEKARSAGGNTNSGKSIAEVPASK